MCYLVTCFWYPCFSYVDGRTIGRMHEVICEGRWLGRSYVGHEAGEGGRQATKKAIWVELNDRHDQVR